MEKGYVMTYQAKSDGHDLTVRIVGGNVMFSFHNSTMPLLVASVIRAKGCIASADGVEAVIEQVA